MTVRQSDDLETLAATYQKLDELSKMLPSAIAAAERLVADGYGGADLVLSWLEDVYPTNRQVGCDSVAEGRRSFELMDAAKGDRFAAEWLLSARGENGGDSSREPSG
jgi:hypothetical protein